VTNGQKCDSNLITTRSGEGGGRGKDRKGKNGKRRREGERVKNSVQLGRDGSRKGGGRERRLKKNRRIGMGWCSGERRSGRIQQSDGVGGRQPEG
jgi:hypothetical protein